ncbi:aminotransferase class III-fold pyridoxal phosphate-dependent enzyme, partial [Arcobacter sp.]|uniref:chemotaxis protein CheW n=1 Tax=Arcobacter sp. TaxID=1872629 RepID=UPI003D0BF23A
DSVQEVIELEPGQIEPAPQMGTRLNTEFIKGMGRRNDKFIILLNIEKIFSEELEVAKALPFVKDIRNIGAIGIIELTNDSYAQEIQDFCMKNGVWIRPFGKLIYSIVAYTIEENDLRKVIKTMVEAIKSIKSKR